jgi:hypothetical protein
LILVAFTLQCFELPQLLSSAVFPWFLTRFRGSVTFL